MTMTRYDIYRSQVARRLHSTAWLMFNIGSKLNNTDMLAAVAGVVAVTQAVHPRHKLDAAEAIAQAVARSVNYSMAFIKRLDMFIEHAIQLLDSGDSEFIDVRDAKPRTKDEKIIAASVQSALMTAAIYWPHKEN